MSVIWGIDPVLNLPFYIPTMGLSVPLAKNNMPKHLAINLKTRDLKSGRVRANTL